MGLLHARHLHRQWIKGAEPLEDDFYFKAD